MKDWIFRNWEHVLCALLLLSRITDLGTTWLVTPKLLLEVNPLVRTPRSAEHAVGQSSPGA